MPALLFLLALAAGPQLTHARRSFASFTESGVLHRCMDVYLDVPPAQVGFWERQTDRNEAEHGAFALSPWHDDVADGVACVGRFAAPVLGTCVWGRDEGDGASITLYLHSYLRDLVTTDTQTCADAGGRWQDTK